MASQIRLSIYARVVAPVLLAVATGCTAASATSAPSESRSEQAFVSKVQTALMQRYPTADDAVKAGYVRFTSVDDTGAISYANMRWQSADPAHPSELWYDAQGRLLGADYSKLLTQCKSRPVVWGVTPARWTRLVGHVHWVEKDALGKLTYDRWAPDAQFVAAGGDLAHPSSVTLVAMHKVANAGDVFTIFRIPPGWDLDVWVKPNANGAFAEKNPAVTP